MTVVQLNIRKLLCLGGKGGGRWANAGHRLIGEPRPSPWHQWHEVHRWVGYIFAVPFHNYFWLWRSSIEKKDTGEGHVCVCVRGGGGLRMLENIVRMQPRVTDFII